MSLKIYLLGQFNLAAGEQQLGLNSRPAQSLFAYLVLSAGMTHRRELLAGLLWPESNEGNARSYLRQALWRIRKTLDDGAVNPEHYLQITDMSVTFNAASDYWLDVDQVLESSETATVDALLETADLYRGELLPGFYDEWISSERDRIQAAYQQKMCQLLEILLQDGRWHEAIKRGEQWIQFAHAPEQAFRMLMSAYAGLEDQMMVQATFERCKDALERELALAPSEETVQLYRELRSGAAAHHGQYSRPPPVIASKQPAFLVSEEPVSAEQTLFVSREREIDTLRELLRQAMDHKGRITFITGEVGSGKTALMSEFSRRVMRNYKNAIVVSGSCNMHTGIGDPYLPFRELLEMLTGDVEGRWAAGAITTNHARQLWYSLMVSTEAVAKDGAELVNTFIHGPSLRERVAACATSEDEWLDRLDQLCAQEVRKEISFSTQQSDYFEQYSRVLQSISRRRPLVLIIDDLQWADLGSINLLFHLSRQIAGCRILILGAYRPEEITLGRDGRRHPLEPVVNEIQRVFGQYTLNLDESQSRAFVDSILDSEPNQLGPSFRHLVFRQTQGNPLFTIELLRGMQERGELRRNENGQWIEEETLNWEILPARVEAVIAERIGRLDQPLRSILRVASIEGEQFSAEVVARVLGHEERRVLVHLDSDLERKHRLVRAQSIERKGDVLFSKYRFQHNLFQNYLYNNLNEIERVRLHEQVGTTLEELYQKREDVPAIATQLARHFTEAQVTNKAIYYLHQAGKKAVELSAYRESITHLEKGLTLLKTLPQSPERDGQELVFQIALAIAFQSMEGNQSEYVREAWKRAQDLGTQTGVTQQDSVVLAELGNYHFVRAEYSRALTISEQALNLALETGDSLQIALSQWHYGLALFPMGKFAQAHEKFADTLSSYIPQEHHLRFVALRGSDAGLSAMAYDACCLWCLGYLDEAQKCSDRSLELALKFNHAFTLADVLSYGGCMYNKICGNDQAQQDCADQLSSLSPRFSHGLWAGEVNCFRGDVLARQGQFEEGLDLIEFGITSNRARNSNLFIPLYYCCLAEAYVRTGRLDAGKAAIDDGIRLATETGEYFYMAELRRVKAKILCLEDRKNEAVDNLQEAVEIARSQEAKSWELRSAIDLARLYQEMGRGESALEVLEPVCSWFPMSADSTDLSRARALVTELT
jgi:DNA-binding SARP family transcriptional activator